MDDQENGKQRSQDTNEYIQEAKKFASKAGSKLKTAFETQREANAAKQKEWDSKRKLSPLDWALSVLLPPLGIWRLWKQRRETHPGQTAGAFLLSSFVMVAGAFVGLFVLLIIANVVSDMRYDMSREKERKAAQALHESLIPEYEELFSGAITLYDQGEYRRAEKAFFEVAQYIEDVKDENSGLYYSENWDNKHAAAILGRAACAMEQGMNSEAQTLVLDAFDVTSSSSDPAVPVPSMRTEQLVTQHRKAKQQEAERSYRHREKSRVPEEFTEAVEDYMEKLNGYTTRLEGSKYTFSNPQVISSNCFQGNDGRWTGTLGWSVHIDSTNREWTAQRFRFIATLSHDYRWRITLARMQIGTDIVALDGEMGRLIPDM